MPNMKALLLFILFLLLIWALTQITGTQRR